MRINISKGSGLVDVPSVVGLTQADAQAQLGRSRPRGECIPGALDRNPKDTVVAQNPVGGQVKIGSAVRLNVSTGTPP